MTVTTKDMERFDMRLGHIEEETSELAHGLTELNMSGKWARALVIMLVPFILTAVVYGVIMFQSQSQFGNAMTRHFDHHEKIIQPSFQEAREGIIELRAEDKTAGYRIDGLDRRVTGNETKIRVLSAKGGRRR